MSEIAVSFAKLTDLASERVGGKSLLANDEFFAPKESLLSHAPAIFIPEKYTELGKWMDGWETRRRRTPGHDWCLVRLGIPGTIRGVNIDTSHFTGNFPEYAALDALTWQGPHSDTPPHDSANWKEIVPMGRLQGNTHNYFSVSSNERFTHVRLRIYPDGGVARLRVYGEARPDWVKLRQSKDPVDLAALENGATVAACNDSFFGPRENLILPGRATNMGGGWETRRRRRPGNDWIVVRLGAAGKIRRIEIDTNHFKGNFPESASVEGLFISETNIPETYFGDTPLTWNEILPRTLLKGHTQHTFESEIKTHAPCNYVRLSIFPDGGVSRLRLFGFPEKDDART